MSEFKEGDIVIQTEACSTVEKNTIAIMVNFKENQYQKGGLQATEFKQNTVPCFKNPHGCTCSTNHRKLTLKETTKYPAEIKILLTKYKEWKQTS